MIKVSVIVPVYNVEKHLEKCLDSLVNQTLKDIEIIVINDGSTDRSQSIIECYKNKYPAIIKVVNQTNQGISASRNKGIELSTGKYISFVDSDDYVKTDMLKKSYEYIEKTHADIIVWNYCEVNENGTILKEEKLPKFKDTNLRQNPSLLFSINAAPWNKLYKRSLFDSVKFPKDRTKYEDLMTITKVLINANKISKLDQCYSYYVIRNNGETRTIDNRSFDIFSVLEDVNNYMKIKSIFDEFYEEITYLNTKHIMYQVLKQRNSKDWAMSKQLINKAYIFLNNNFPNWKTNRYYKCNENMIKRTIKNNQLLVKVYCQICRVIQGGKNK